MKRKLADADAEKDACEWWVNTENAAQLNTENEELQQFQDMIETPKDLSIDYDLKVLQ